MDIPKRSKTDHCVLFLFFSGKTRAYVYVQRCWKTPTCCRQYIQDINWNKMIQQIHRISRKSVHKAEICLQQGQWSQFHPVPVSGWNRGARLGGMPGMEAPFRDLCDANMCKYEVIFLLNMGCLFPSFWYQFRWKKNEKRLRPIGHPSELT